MFRLSATLIGFEQTINLCRHYGHNLGDRTRPRMTTPARTALANACFLLAN
jgi:hypothetical protein